MEKTNEKKVLIASAIAIILLIIVVIGVTYAFFQAQGGGSASTNVDVSSSTTDNLSFEVKSAININANQDNFGPGAGNLSGNTTASATLTANNATNTATANYNVYLDIYANQFVYTTDEKTAELLLTIEDPEGNELTELEGYNYVTVNDTSGFDITTNNNTIIIANNYEISATDQPTTQEWNITVTFVNLDSNQNANTGKNFGAELKIQQEEIELAIHETCVENTLICNILKNYKIDGDNDLYYHDGQGIYANASEEAGDNSYRYAGANPNNYICFGSDEEICPADNLYRIIGVFDGKAKLIKADVTTETDLGTTGDFSATEPASNYADTYKGSKETIYKYYWNNVDQSNNWTTSNLNLTNLNSTYLNSLSSWSEKVATTTWQIGGNTYKNIRNSTVKNSYESELITPATDTTYNAKIGLMYVSDYGYGASPENWKTNIGSYGNTEVTSNNWLYLGVEEASITKRSGSTNYMFRIMSSGGVSYGEVTSSYAIRPCFYLNSDVALANGTGTESDPYRII